MSIRIRRVADPGAVLLLDHQFDDEGIEAEFAATLAREVVVHELERYCRGLIEGRSILIAGHRGAGKTSMVKSALLEMREEQDRLRLRKPPMRPLPVYLQAQRIFGLDDAEDAPVCAPALASDPVKTTHYDPAHGTLIEKTSTRVAQKHDNVLLQRTLVLSILELHRSVAREFSQRFWRKAGDGGFSDRRRA
jgi:energy-coupling factor transporter ATP-binding protein EcfA2